MIQPMRIVLTGAECSGKSTLTRYLGERFALPSAPEYARIYLEENGPKYDLSLLQTMSCEHLLYQKQQVPDSAPAGLLDTDLINYKIWAEEVFGHCPEIIRNGIERESRHVYLVCAPDLPWEPDPLRENPHDRPRLFQRHLHEIRMLGRRYEIVSGKEEERFASAETALTRLSGLLPIPRDECGPPHTGTREVLSPPELRSGKGRTE